MSLFFTFGLHSSDVVVFWNIKLKKLVLFEAQIIILKLCHFVECISKTEYNAKSLIEPHYLTCINKNHGSNSPFFILFRFLSKQKSESIFHFACFYYFDI